MKVYLGFILGALLQQLGTYTARYFGASPVNSLWIGLGVCIFMCILAKLAYGVQS